MTVIVNEQIRRAVNIELAKRDMKRSDLAEGLGMQRQYLSDILNGKAADFPKSWQSILESLDLELVAIPRKKGVFDDDPTINPS